MFLGKRLEDGRSARKKSCECSRMYPTNRTKTLGSGEPLLPAFVYHPFGHRCIESDKEESEVRMAASKHRNGHKSE